MKKLVFRLILVGILAFCAFVYTFPWNNYGIQVPFTWNEYKMWLDLQWGIELDYKIDLDDAKKAKDFDNNSENAIVEWLKSIIDKRVESLKINDSIITSANYAWEKHIIVQIPLKWNSNFENSENIKKAKDAIWKVVKIEFKEKRTTISDEDKKERKDLARKSIEELKNSKDWFTPTAEKYRDNYENVDFWTLTGSIEELNNYFSIDYEKINKWVFNDIVSWTWKTQIAFVDGELNEKSWELWYFVLDYLWNSNTASWTIHSFNYIFLNKSPSDWMPAKDKQGRILNDKYFVKSSVQYNEAFRPMIELTFNTEWADIFWELTTRLKGQQIAIFVWWHMLTAPNVNDAILSWKAVITWDYTSEEAVALSQDINTWVVPAPIYLTSERTIDSKLWNNSLDKLIQAWLIWLVLIIIFLIFVYRLSWLVASIALLIYISLVLAFVKMFWVVLTLASIAWLILSIWMAIDANILIFERLKDNLREWKKLDEALKLWFQSSFSAIWDSNLTWLLVAIILFMFWINLIKWFWLMLWLWIIISLFTVLYISKLFIITLSKAKINQKNFIWKI